MNFYKNKKLNLSTINHSNNFFVFKSHLSISIFITKTLNMNIYFAIECLSFIHKQNIIKHKYTHYLT